MLKYADIHTCSIHNYTGTSECPLCRIQEYNEISLLMNLHKINYKLKQAKRIIKMLWDERKLNRSDIKIYEQQIFKLLRESKKGIDYDTLKKRKCINSNRVIGTCIERCIVDRLKAGDDLKEVFDDYNIKIKD